MKQSPQPQERVACARRWRGVRKLFFFYFICAGLLLSTCAESPRAQTTLVAAELTQQGDPVRGQQAFLAYGCHTCHHIPGIPGANAYVGPPLIAWAERSYIAGILPNTPANLHSFLQYPQSFLPNGAMPNMGVTPEDAQDMGAYLYTLHASRQWNLLNAMGW